MISRVKSAFHALKLDQKFLTEETLGAYKAHTGIVVLAVNDSLRALFLMRLAAAGGLLGRFSRTLLLAMYSCDVSPGATIEGGISVPHPVGIVIGSGVHVKGGVWIFQNVTLGSDGRGGYPTICAGAKIFPNATVVGNIMLGESSRVGANSFVSTNVASGETRRHNTRIDESCTGK